MQIDEKINREEQTAALECTDEVCEKGDPWWFAGRFLVVLSKDQTSLFLCKLTHSHSLSGSEAQPSRTS